MVQMSKRVIIFDVSGKVLKYDEALFRAIFKKSLSACFNISLYTPGHGLLQLVPKRFSQSESRLKRLIKALESTINYFRVLLLLIFRRIDVIHFQWLPFLDFVGVESFFLRIMHSVSRNTRYVLTIHNVYPHNMSVESRRLYRKRFTKIKRRFDSFIVHTKSSKDVIVKEFDIDPSLVEIICHGIYVPDRVVKGERITNSKRIRFLQFGSQSYYKGTDVFVQAVAGLPVSYSGRADFRIVGGTSPSFLKDMMTIDSERVISWKPYFLSDDELYSEINEADIIVVPYREISQSGVLLLSLFFEKPIIASDLPSFKETLMGFDDDLFFHVEDYSSLRSLLMRYIDGNIDIDQVSSTIKRLKALYSWDKAASDTLSLYSKLCKA